MDTHEGTIPIDGYNIWYRQIGNGGVPLLLLHGGPGAGHDYLEPLEALATDRTVILYDQLGCGKSDQPDDPSLWTIDRFVAEVAAVRRALGLDHVHLFGSSWGGWLAIEYMLTHPTGITSLTLASTSASIQQFVAEAERLKAALPQDTRRVMERYEQAQDWHHPDYEAAVMLFYQRHLCRLDPWPDCLQRSSHNLDDNAVYASLNGPNEFIVTGALKDWDRTDRLGEITVPTLITVGRFDEIPPACAETLHRGIPGSQLRMFEHSAHVAHIEEPEAYRTTLADFFSRVEEREISE